MLSFRLLPVEVTVRDEHKTVEVFLGFLELLDDTVRVGTAAAETVEVRSLGTLLSEVRTLAVPEAIPRFGMLKSRVDNTACSFDFAFSHGTATVDCKEHLSLHGMTLTRKNTRPIRKTAVRTHASERNEIGEHGSCESLNDGPRVELKFVGLQDHLGHAVTDVGPIGQLTLVDFARNLSVNQFVFTPAFRVLFRLLAGEVTLEAVVFLLFVGLAVAITVTVLVLVILVLVVLTITLAVTVTVSITLALTLALSLTLTLAILILILGILFKNSVDFFKIKVFSDVEAGFHCLDFSDVRESVLKMSRHDEVTNLRIAADEVGSLNREGTANLHTSRRMVQEQTEELNAHQNRKGFDAQSLHKVVSILNDRCGTFAHVKSECHLRFFRKCTLVAHVVERTERRVDEIHLLLHLFELLIGGQIVSNHIGLPLV